MALINCPNCGKPISDQAPFCPHCGCELGKPQRKSPKKSHTTMILMIALGICAVAVALLFALTRPAPQEEAANEALEAAPLEDSYDKPYDKTEEIADVEFDADDPSQIRMTEIVIVDDDEAAEYAEVVQAAEEAAEIAIADNPRQEILSVEETAEVAAPATQAVEEEPYHIAMVEQRPTFPGGDAGLYRWLAEHIVYPPEAAEEGVSGRVVVEMVINKDGSISDTRIVRSKHPALDREALRVVNAMPRWNPGRINGAPVRVTYMLPVTFRLQ